MTQETCAQLTLQELEIACRGSMTTGIRGEEMARDIETTGDAPAGLRTRASPVPHLPFQLFLPGELLLPVRAAHPGNDTLFTLQGAVHFWATAFLCRCEEVPVSPPGGLGKCFCSTSRRGERLVAPADNA